MSAPRRASTSGRIHPPACPKCHGTGVVEIDGLDPDPCDLCNGDKVVSLAVATKWILSQGSVAAKPDEEDTEPKK